LSVKRTIGFLGAVLVVCGMVWPAAADDWPQFRGPKRDGISAETGLYRNWPAGGPKLLWAVTLRGPGYSGPAVVGGKVFINDYDQTKSAWLVRCFSLADGKELWRYSQRKRIRPNHLITRTVPASDGKYVFSLDPKCVFHCLDAATGKELWEKNLVREYGTMIPPWYAGQCPLIEEDRVLIAPGGRKALVVALDKATGKELWRTANGKKWKMSHSSLMPASFGGVKQYVYCTLKGLVGVEAAGGKVLWEFPWRFNVAVAPSPLVIDDDRVFMTSLYNADSVMFRVSRAEDGSFRTEKLFDMPPSKWNSEVHTPILFKRHMFAVGKKMRGLFTCVDLEGNIVWTSPPRKTAFGLGSFLLADGLFFVLEGRTGTLRLVEANTEEYRELGSCQVLSGPDVWAPMALSNGRLLARDTKKLVCLAVGPAAVAEASGQ